MSKSTAQLPQTHEKKPGDTRPYKKSSTPPVPSRMIPNPGVMVLFDCPEEEIGIVEAERYINLSDAYPATQP